MGTIEKQCERCGGVGRITDSSSTAGESVCPVCHGFKRFENTGEIRFCSDCAIKDQQISTLQQENKRLQGEVERLEEVIKQLEIAVD